MCEDMLSLCLQNWCVLASGFCWVFVFLFCFFNRNSYGYIHFSFQIVARTDGSLFLSVQGLGYCYLSVCHLFYVNYYFVCLTSMCKFL